MTFAMGGCLIHELADGLNHCKHCGRPVFRSQLQNDAYYHQLFWRDEEADVNDADTRGPRALRQPKR